LPWLQKVLGDFEVVPIAMGSQSYEASRALGVALAKLAKAEALGGETLVLASSDLSHYHSAMRRRGSTGRLSALWRRGTTSVCRATSSCRYGRPVGARRWVAAMIYAERMGANQARVLKYANSGDITG